MAFTGRHYAPKIVHSLPLIVAQFSPLRAAAYVGVSAPLIKLFYFIPVFMKYGIKNKE
jgi:hypothetical protein